MSWSKSPWNSTFGEVVTVDLMLLTVTAISLVAALVFGIVAWRLAKGERGRSLARIAALSAAARADRPAPGEMSARGSHATARDDEATKPAWTFPAQVTPRASGPRGRAQAVGLRAEPTLDLAIRPEAPPPATALGDSFLGGTLGAPRADHRQRTLAITAAALLVMLGGGIAWTLAVPRSAPAAGAAAAATSLELVSLRHERQGPNLAVSGLVRNPAVGHAVNGVSAVVLLFDQAGGLVTSGHAQIDRAQLGPGDESPFAIAIAAPPTVARYRVSFKTEAGVMPHIDRRNESPVSNGAPAAARASAPGE